MSRTIPFLLALLASAAAAAGAPLLPDSALGVARPVHITDDQRLLVLSGGRHNGTVAGYEAFFWCVDAEHFASPGLSYQANVTMLANWENGRNPLVQKGSLDSSGFYWSGLGLTAQQRYQGAAYLVTQMRAWQTGVAQPADVYLQQAIWGLLDDAEFQSVWLGDEAVARMQAAAAYILANPEFGLGQWAVISGNVNPAGEFEGYQVQTFLARLAAPQLPPDGGAATVHNPEPATFVLLGAGLAALFVARRRRSREASTRSIH